MAYSLPSHNEALLADIASRLNGNTALMSHVVEIQDKAEDVQLAPIGFMLEILKTIGDHIGDLPVPGSRDGNNPDYIKTLKKDGTPSEREESFYTRLFGMTTVGLQLEAQRKYLAKWHGRTPPDTAATNDKVHGDLEILISGLTDTEATSMKARVAKRFSVGRSRFYRAFEVKSMFQRIASDLPNLTADFIWDKRPTDNQEGVITRSPQCITIYENEDRGQYKNFTLDQFVNINVMAVANGNDKYDGGTVKALKGLGLVKGADDPAKKEGKFPVPSGIDELESALAAIGQFFDKQGLNHMATRLTTWVEEPAEQDERDRRILLIGDVAMALEGVYSLREPEYAALTMKRTQLRRNEAGAKAEKSRAAA